MVCNFADGIDCTNGLIIGGLETDEEKPEVLVELDFGWHLGDLLVGWSLDRSFVRSSSWWGLVSGL